jgi:trehalose/maltose hydrolase-like predicted phosphorylase
MARWNLERGREVVRLLQRRWPGDWSVLRERLGITPEEVRQWRTVAERIWVGRDPRSGVLEQFAGFFGLEPVDLAAYSERTQPMDVVLGRERTQRSQVIKQADVVMLQALLPEQFRPEEHAANFRYYERRCGQGSSLSPAFHALVAARLGDVALAEAFLHQTAAIDLEDRMGNGAQGIHIAALGGLWQAVVFGFAGLSLRPDGLHLDPHLPATWRALRFGVQWRGRRLRIEIRRGSLRVAAHLECGRPMTLGVRGAARRLSRGRPVEFDLDEGRAAPPGVDAGPAAAAESGPGPIACS